MRMSAKSLQSCRTPCDPMNCSLPGSSVHGDSPGEILEWVAIPHSKGSSQPRDWIHISLALKVQSLNHRTAREVPCKCNFYAPGNQKKKKKIVWYALLWYSLYCSGQEPNLQYLWDECVSAPNIKPSVIKCILNPLLGHTVSFFMMKNAITYIPNFSPRA